MLQGIKETILLGLANIPLRFGGLDRRRWQLIRMAGAKVEECEIRGPVNLTQFGALNRISIGRGTFINVGLRIGVSEPATVRIGENCAIGPYVCLETVNHNMVWTPLEHWGRTAKSITIGDRCWIGARVVILAGVTIGEGAVVAAGAVVTSDVEPYTFVAGIPARFKRNISQDGTRPAAISDSSP